MARNVMFVLATRNDIMDGLPGDPHLCPVALMIRRALGPAADHILITVDTDGVDLTDTVSGHSLYLIHDAAHFIEDFDDEGPEETLAWTGGEFVIELKDPLP